MSNGKNLLPPDDVEPAFTSLFLLERILDINGNFIFSAPT